MIEGRPGAARWLGRHSRLSHIGLGGGRRQRDTPVGSASRAVSSLDLVAELLLLPGGLLVQSGPAQDRCRACPDGGRLSRAEADARGAHARTYWRRRNSTTPRAPSATRWRPSRCSSNIGASGEFFKVSTLTLSARSRNRRRGYATATATATATANRRRDASQKRRVLRDAEGLCPGQARRGAGWRAGGKAC